MLLPLFRTSLGFAIAVSATVLTIAASAAPAAASSFDTPRRAEISTSGVDLATAAGRAQINARLARAAASVCAVDGADAWRHRAEVRACTATALAGATQRLASLTARNAVADASPAASTVNR